MSDDGDSFLGVAADLPTAKQVPVDAAARRVRWSLITFIIGTGLIFAGLFMIWIGEGYSVARWWTFTGVNVILCGDPFLLASCLLGFWALCRRRMVVLWWTIPALLALGFQAWCVSQIRIGF